MAKRKTKRRLAPKKPKLTPQQRALAKRLKEVHRMLIPANVQAALGRDAWNPDSQVLRARLCAILEDTILQVRASKSIEHLSRYILDTAPPERLDVIHSTFLHALKSLPVRVCRLDTSIDLATDVMHWYEQSIRPEPLPPEPGDRRDGMEAALCVG